MFKAKFTEDAPLELSFLSDGPFGISFSEAQRVFVGVRSGTTEYWNSQQTLIGEENVIYVYTDHQTKTDRYGHVTDVPGIKIGDGKAYLIDLPFTDEIYLAHIGDASIHCTQAEKDLWNNKVRVLVSRLSPENLIFTIN